VHPRVAEQVGEHLVQALVVALHQYRALGQLELPPVIGPGGPRVAGRVDRQPGQVDGPGLQRAARVKPGQQQQVLDQRAHPG